MWIERNIDLNVQFQILAKTIKILEKIRKLPVIQVHIYKQSGQVSINSDVWIERNIDLNVSRLLIF